MLLLPPSLEMSRVFPHLSVFYLTGSVLERFKGLHIQNEFFSLAEITAIRLEFFNFLSHFPGYHFHSKTSLVCGILLFIMSSQFFNTFRNVQM